MLKKKILVVSPHPDDESLGAGGYLLKNKKEDLFWLNFTDVNIEAGYSKDFFEKRQLQIKKVIKHYGFKDFFNLKLPTCQLDSLDKHIIIQKVSEIIKKIKPNIVILPYKYDIHTDHRFVFDCCYSNSKIFRYPFIKKIIMMEILSETEFALPSNSQNFSPNMFVDITENFEKKQEIISIYESEIGNHPFPRSMETIEALAKFRGAMAGCKYAESFMILKEVL